MDKEKVLAKIAEDIYESCQIDSDLFDTYNVKRGLRNADGSGVLVGLTNIGNVIGYERNGDELIPIDGKLMYRGISLEDIIKGIEADNRLGFEETVFLLLSGKLPTKEELHDFQEYLAIERELPEPFTNVILTIKGKDIMNILARSVLVFYTFDGRAEDSSHENIVKQCLSLVAKFPTIIVYAYHALRHKYNRETLVIRHPQHHLTTAENLLYMLKGKYTPLEAQVLDNLMISHAEHSGGNNSTFTIRVTSSSGTDTYSAISSAIASLKGPLHGGANIKVQEMLENIKANVINWKDENEIKGYLHKILRKEAFDRSGKIYGIGHAVYTKSDPRTAVLRGKARALAIEKDRLDEFELLETIERLSIIVFSEYKGDKKTVCANVDFYSGFVYDCIGIPKELYTPLFAASRIAGWSAHRLEEVTFSARRIIRPAYKNVYIEQEYMPMADRPVEHI